MKRIISLIITLVAIVAGASAQNGSFAWYGSDGKAKVETGLGNGTNTEGLWYVRDDSGDGGASTVVWDVATQDGKPDDNLVQQCGGISGTAVLDKGHLIYSPFVNICFDVAGERYGYPEAADASAWGGIAIAYTCDVAPTLELGLGEVDATIGYANPQVELSASPNGVRFVRIPWSAFKQPNWYNEQTKISGLEAAQQLVAVRFKVQEKNGSYHFKIVGIGSYNMQKSEDWTEVGGGQEDFAWYGSNGKAKVETGLGNGTNTEGLWYVFDDSGDGGASTVVWDVATQDGKPNDNLVSQFGGISGTAVLDKGNLIYNPFVKVCFDVAGKNEYTGDIEAADASAWGGIAIAYQSDVAPVLELGLGDVDATIGYENPRFSLPASPDAVNFVRIPWSAFKQPEAYTGQTKISGLDAAQQLVTVRFKVQAKPGSYHFKVVGIGSYNMQKSEDWTEGGGQGQQDPTDFAWYGSNGKAKVETGLGNGTNTEGIWYVFDDSGDGGASTVVWDVATQDGKPDDNLVQQCGGISGTAVLNKGYLTYSPFVNICFDVAGERYGYLEAADASAWGGIAIAYTCDVAPTLELGLGDFDAAIGYNNPQVKLSASPDAVNFVRIPWSSFKQPETYHGSTKISGLEAAQQLVTVRFKVQEKKWQLPL